MFILEGKDCKDLRNNWSNVQTENKPNNFNVLYNNDLKKKMKDFLRILYELHFYGYLHFALLIKVEAKSIFL